MQIKWLNQYNGVKSWEKWSGISQARALEMLKRNDPKHYELRLFALSMGEEVSTKTYALRGSPNDKFDT